MSFLFDKLNTACSLPVRLGLLGKGIKGPWIWLDMGLWKSPIQCNLM